MSGTAINTNAATAVATPSCGASSRRPGEDTPAGDGVAAAGVAAGLLLAWQAALDGRGPAEASGGGAPAASGTVAALQAALEASGDADAARASALTALQPAAPVVVQATFRTGPGEPWQLELRRDAIAERTTLSLGAGFVPPVMASAQLPRLGARLRRQGQAVDRLEWRQDGRQDAREDAE